MNVACYKMCSFPYYNDDKPLAKCTQGCQMAKGCCEKGNDVCGSEYYNCKSCCNKLLNQGYLRRFGFPMRAPEKCTETQIREIYIPEKKRRDEKRNG